MKIGIGIWGVSGLLGEELRYLLSLKPEMEVVYTSTSKETTGGLADVEVAFLALSAEQSMRTAPKLLKEKVRVIDLSGAYRFRDA